MSTYKIASWNVNSIRARMTHLTDWMNAIQPDILAMQETKVQDDSFPIDHWISQGYTSVFSGQKSYNGVAIISKNPITDVIINFPDYDDSQKRVLAATINDIRVINVYIPNGQTVLSEKFQYKLNWLSKLKSFISSEMAKYPKLVILGDFNIAPAEIDVYDPKKWEGQVLFTDVERQNFKDLLALGLIDAFRHLNPEEQTFSWWDYRMNAFKRNLGLRIDHLITSTTLTNAVQQCYIDKIPRTWEKPSDHAPIVGEFLI